MLAVNANVAPPRHLPRTVYTTVPCCWPQPPSIIIYNYQSNPCNISMNSDRSSSPTKSERVRSSRAFMSALGMSRPTERPRAYTTGQTSVIRYEAQPQPQDQSNERYYQVSTKSGECHKLLKIHIHIGSYMITKLGPNSTFANVSGPGTCSFRPSG
jgi:hypothetical protein